MPASLAVAMVCKNNAATLRPVLDALAPLSPLIIAVDSGSTDETISMLERAASPASPTRIVRSPWLGHVRTKQMALELASPPNTSAAWVLCLDTDEVVLPGLAADIQRVLDLPPDDPALPRGYRLNRKVCYAGRVLEHTFQPEWRLRLVRPGSARWMGHDPHDTLTMVDSQGRPDRAARVGDLAGDLRHDSFASIADHFAKGVSYAKLSAEQIGGDASIWRLLTSPAGAFLKQVVLKQAYRDGWRGIVAASSTAVLAAMKHAYAIELARTSRARPAGNDPGGGNIGH